MELELYLPIAGDKVC